jgi:hypothetical protein
MANRARSNKEDDTMTQLADQAARLADQEAEIRRLKEMIERQTRRSPESPEPEQRETRQPSEATIESAFGGRFKATGVAALPSFEPLRGDSKGLNPQYSDKAKARGENPGKFNGDEKEFDHWVQKLADKFEEDASTFRSERSRMVYMMTQLEGDAQKVVEARYRSTEDPFSCVAEMVQVLETTYHDPNQASAARNELRNHLYRPGKMKIQWFISRFNTLAQQGGIPKKDWKVTLWEHLPKSLDNSLLRYSKDQSITYETFCSIVADAAYSDQLAYEERNRSYRTQPNGYQQARKSSPGKVTEKKPKENQTIVMNQERETTKATRDIRKTRALTETEKEAHRRAGTCYYCGERGHRVLECPKKDRPSVARVTQEMLEKESDSETNSGKE